MEHFSVKLMMTDSLHKGTDGLYTCTNIRYAKSIQGMAAFTRASKLRLCICHRCSVASISPLVPITVEQPFRNVMFQNFKKLWRCWTFIPSPLHFNYSDTCMYLYCLFHSASLPTMEKAQLDFDRIK